MTRKLFTVIALLTFALSACGGGGAAQTGTPTATNTQIPTVSVATTAPAMTETPTPDGTAVTFTPTVGTVAPTNPPDCTNSASFVADITIPDNTNVAAATTFTKIWRIANNGTCVWGPDYKLTHYSEERMSAPDTVPLGITYPGENLDISVDLTAPNSTGRHQANFVIENPAGLIMKIGDDSRLWVVINVTVDGSAPTGTATATSASAAATTSAALTATGAVTAISTIPAVTVSTSNPGPATCLFAIDRTKLTEVIKAVNEYRADKGLAAFTVDPLLAQAAQRHANDMACNRLFVHKGSDGSTPQTRVADTGYIAASVTENVYGSKPPLTGEGAVNWWITDKTDLNYNKNLLSTTYTEIGVGYSFFESYGYYVIVFAKP